MKLLGLVSLAAFLGMGATVGVRLVLLARRTRGAPEACAGAGLLCLAVLAHPFSALARLPGLVGTLPGHLLFAVGMATTAAGITLLYEFTRRTFRPGRAWALALVAAAGLAACAETAGLWVATAGAARIEDILPRARPWTVAICLTLAGSFAWTALEGAVHHARLRRRLALGLADPVVADRVRLWAASGVAAAALLVQIAALAARGRMVLHDPMALLLTALCGAATASLWYLAFLPPPAYLRRVRRRAAQRSSNPA
jgi:hypothetical protein